MDDILLELLCFGVNCSAFYHDEVRGLGLKLTGELYGSVI